MGTSELNAEGNSVMDYRGVEILLVHSFYRNRDKLLMGHLTRVQTVISTDETRKKFGKD